jgi:hypothetical protein
MNGMHRVLWAFLVTAGLAVGLSGCANTGSSTSVAVGPDGKLQNPVQLLGQLPLPPGAVIRADQSLIIGAGDNWVGRVVLDVGRDVDAAYRYFSGNLPGTRLDRGVGSARQKQFFGHDPARAHGDTRDGGRRHDGQQRFFDDGTAQCSGHGAEKALKGSARITASTNLRRGGRVVECT